MASPTRETTIAPSVFLRRASRRLLIGGGSTALIILLLGFVGYMLRPGLLGRDSAFYTPGVTPSREDCALAKMKTYAKVDRMVLQSIAAECELTVQSIEGHEKLRKAWEERQAARDAAPKPAPAEPAAPAETDRLRRVWR